MVRVVTAVLVAVLMGGCIKREESAQRTNERGQATQVKVVSLIGTVQIRQPGESVWRTACGGTFIGQGTIVRTADESRVTLAFPQQGEVVVSENGLLSVNIEQLPDSTLSSAVNLRSGIVLAVLRDMVGGRRSSFRVRTPTVTATIRGTSFKAQVDAVSGKVALLVLQGAVAVKGRDYGRIIGTAVVADSSLAAQARGGAQWLSVDSLDNMMQALESDWEYEVEKQVLSETVHHRQELNEQVAQGIIDKAVLDSLVTLRKQERVATLSIGTRPFESLVVTAGTVVETEAQQAVLTQRNYAPQELRQMQQLFSDTLVQRALKPNPSRKAPPESSDGSRLDEHSPQTLRFATIPPTQLEYGQEFIYKPIIVGVRSEALRFVLLEAPSGMTIDSVKQQLRWIAQQECSVAVCLVALGGVDTLAMQRFELVVIAGVELGLTVEPKVGDTTTVFSLTPTVSENVAKINVDYEGDGIWDTSVTPGSVVSCRYSAPGKYALRCEAQGVRGERRELSERVVVDVPPRARALVTPPIIMPGGVAIFDAGGSEDNAAGLGYRWDIDGDGVWEYPPQGYSESAAVEHQFFRRAQGQAVVEVIDTVGLTAQTRVDYKVGYPCRARAFEVESVNMVQAALLRGEGSDMDDSIVWYGWDYEGDRVVDWESDSLSQTTHRYPHEGVYRATFMVRSADGSSAQAQTKVTVVNEAPKAIAGEEQVCVVNSACRFEGTGVDVDGTIISYAWDFDGDRTVDYTSSQSGVGEFVYTEKGVYKPVLTVTSADGQVAKAVTTVRVVSRLGLVMKR